MGREAQVWKKQHHLTKLDVEHSGKLLLREQLKVKIALHTMRKACVEGSDIEKERAFIEKKKRRDLKSKVPYSEKHPVSIKTIEQIQEEAKVNVGLMKNKLKLDNESKKLGKPRPIFTQLIAEIRADQYKRFLNRAKKLGKQMTDAQMKFEPHASLDDSDGVHRKATSSPKSGTSSSHRLRPVSAPALSHSLKTYDQVVVQEAIALAAASAEHNQDHFNPDFDFELFYNKPSEMLKRSMESRNNSVSTVVPIMPIAVTNGYSVAPNSAAAVPPPAAAVAAARLLNIKLPAKEETPETNNVVSFGPSGATAAAATATAAPPAAPSRPGVGLIRQMSANQKGSLLRSSTSKSILQLGALDEGSPATQQQQQMQGVEEVAAFAKPLLSKMQSYKSSFSLSIVENDDRIQKVQKVRDEMVQEKEDLLKRRIQEREDSYIARTQLKSLMEKQRAWLGLTALLDRLRVMKEALIEAKRDKVASSLSLCTLKAIALIEKWWIRKRISMKFKRYPKIHEVLRRYLILWFVRLRLWKKRRSSTLLLTFLQDSTGISESMRKIYKYRQKIIKLQRFIRGWLDMQFARVQVLWMHAENLTKKIQKAERIEEIRQEKESMKAISRIAGFTDTASNLNDMKKRISKLLQEQEDVKRSRELQFQQEQAELKRLEEAHQEALLNLTGSKLARYRREQEAAAAAVAAAAKEKRNRRPNIPWHRRIRAVGPQNVKLFKMLQGILHRQRRRHLLNLEQSTKKHMEASTRIDMNHVKSFLKDPNGTNGSYLISHSLVDSQQITTTRKERSFPPFLLYTKGGLDSVELLLLSSKDIRFVS